jgi:hypothetical protein
MSCVEGPILTGPVEIEDGKKLIVRVGVEECGMKL